MSPLPVSVYAIFAGPLYYPSGGWNDLKYLSNNKDEIKRHYRMLKRNRNYDWIQVINLTTLKVIKLYGNRPSWANIIY